MVWKRFDSTLLPHRLFVLTRLDDFISFPQTDLMCHYLTVRSLLEAKEYGEALQVINESEICTNMTQSGVSFSDHTDIMQDAPKNVSSN